GFTRLDALNRIGNAVFAKGLERPENYAPINAPVNYPHLWTTPWFNWVQYDGSIMQPLIRNSGEALGLEAAINLTKGEKATRKGHSNAQYSSSVPVPNLHDIEKWVAGKHPLKDELKDNYPSYEKKDLPTFTGLQSPKWPFVNKNEVLDIAKVSHGKRLYKKHCQKCHLPSFDDPEFWTDTYWEKISYTKDDNHMTTKEKYLKMEIIPLGEINTDPAQATILEQRTVDIVGLGIETEICVKATPATGTLDCNNGDDCNKKWGDTEKSMDWKLTYVPFKDSATASFALALGAVVDQTNKRWFEQNYTTKHWQDVYEGGRPNCLQAAQGYKARPLNGVWATAPFLHNGSIATIYDLLSTQTQRPTFVELGSLEF
ncbi:MAG: hypothetical protein D3925_16080, partial [Candidatus Electrothrix sp. AR5]|nr:hypothetical protein [Candidatus Electrothrix sp. AR5]